MTQQITRCPVPDCKQTLIEHDTHGVPSPSNPLHITILLHAYECPDHGFFSYEGDRRFVQLPG